MSLAIAGAAMLALVRAAEAPQTEFKDPAYAPDHKIIPVPIMGIRGEADVLLPPPAA